MLSESELDAILTGHVREYNRPPGDPPLESVRARVFESRRRSSRGRIAAFGLGVAAAAAMIVVSVARQPEVRRDASVLRHDDTNAVSTLAGLDARTESANRALVAAVRSAERAAAAHPGDPYYVEHLEAMTENAEHFRMLQRQHLGASL